MKPRWGRLAGAELLVVEDHADLRELLTAMLHLEGAEVEAVSSGQEALDVLQGRSVDLLICDLRLPDLSGHNLIRTVRGWPRAEGGKIPALAVTGYGSPQDRRTALAAGFDAYLEKPVDGELIRVATLLLLDAKAAG